MYPFSQDLNVLHYVTIIKGVSHMTEKHVLGQSNNRTLKITIRRAKRNYNNLMSFGELGTTNYNVQICIDKCLLNNIL